MQLNNSLKNIAQTEIWMISLFYITKKQITLWFILIKPVDLYRAENQAQENGRKIKKINGRD